MADADADAAEPAATATANAAGPKMAWAMAMAMEAGGRKRAAGSRRQGTALLLGVMLRLDSHSFCISWLCMA